MKQKANKIGKSSFRSFYDDHDNGARQPKPNRTRDASASTRSTNGDSVSTSMSTVQTSNQQQQQQWQWQQTQARICDMNNKLEESSFALSASSEDAISSINDNNNYSMVNNDTTASWPPEERPNNDNIMGRYHHNKNNNHGMMMASIQENWSQDHHSSAFHMIKESSDGTNKKANGSGTIQGDLEQQQHQKYNSQVINNDNTNSTIEEFASTEQYTPNNDYDTRTYRNINFYAKSNLPPLEPQDYSTNEQLEHFEAPLLPDFNTATTDDLSVASSASSGPRQHDFGLERIPWHCDYSKEPPSSLPPPLEQNSQQALNLENGNVTVNGEPSYFDHNEVQKENYDNDEGEEDNDEFYEDFDAQTTSAATRSSADYPGAHRMYGNRRVRLRKHEPVDDPNQPDCDALSNNNVQNDGDNQNSSNDDHDNTATNNTSDTVQDQIEFEQLSATQESFATKRKSFLLLFAAVIIVLVVVGVVVAIVVSGGKNRSDLPGNKDQASPTTFFQPCAQQVLPDTSRSPEEILMRYQYFSDELSTSMRNFDARNIPDDVCDPGHLSVLWLAQSTIELEVPKDVLINRYLLAVIYFTMDGDDWKVNDAWLSDAAVCEWYGVDCDGENNDNEEIITELSLPSNDIGNSITIPEEIGFLSALRVLDLSDNNMAGTLPSSLFQLRDLYFLRLDDNDVEGNFPFDELTMNTNLRVLALGGGAAKLEGHLSSDIGRLTNLEYFDFEVFFIFNTGVVGLQGTLPTEIGLLSNLVSFSIQHSKVRGKIPTEIGHLTNLALLQLSETEITELVTEMGLLQKLRWLDLSRNTELKGTLISEIGNLSSLETLNLSVSPSLSGSFPTEIGHLTSLRNLDLRQVGMEGIPTEIGRCTALEIWTNSNSCLGGQIPSEIGNLSNLELLEFASSCLTGIVPSEVFGLESLVSLSLSEPDLKGTVPDNLSHLSNLACLDLMSDLQGTIPCDFPQFEDGFEFEDVENVERYLTQLPPNNLDIYYTCQTRVWCGGDCCKNCAAFVRCREANSEAVMKIFNDQIITLQNEILSNITF